MTTMKTASASGVWRYRQPRNSTYCPYKFGSGIDLARNATGTYANLLDKSHLIYLIVGGGQLFDRSDDNPFKTFCRDDKAATASDWAAVGADMWGGAFRVALNDSRARKFLDKYLETAKQHDTKKKRPKQLELFKHGK